MPQQLTFCVSCQVEFRDRLILLSNAREPKAVMAGCPPLWLLSEGQASESDSPTGEKEPSIKRTTFYPQLTSIGLQPYRNNAKCYIYD
jgi:hypothetical protein